MSAPPSERSLMCDNHWCLLESTDNGAFESIKCRLIAWSGALMSGSTVRGRKRNSKNPSSPLSLSDSQTSFNNIFIHRYAVSCGRGGESTSFFLYMHTFRTATKLKSFFLNSHCWIIKRVHSVHNTHRKQSDHLLLAGCLLAYTYFLIPSRPFG